MKRLALTFTLLTLVTAACAKVGRPAQPSVHPSSPADKKPVVPVDTWTQLNMTSPDGKPLSRDELYVGPASYACAETDRTVIEKINGEVNDKVKIVKADVSKHENKPAPADVADAEVKVGDSIYLCNQLRSTIDLSTCKNPDMLLDVNNVGGNCDRLADLLSSVETVKKLIIK